MYGWNELKQKISIEENLVECPVKHCNNKVERQKQVFKREQRFQCPVHKIFISPSTFEYETEHENLLWYDPKDSQLFEQILKVKRESRIARDNSEDALTWNVMRYLDKQSMLPQFLSKLSGKEIKEAELILWSYSPKEKSNWTLLNKARLEFGETVARGSEPDIIILTDKVLFILEAKLTAFNETKPSDLKDKKKYESGGDQLFQRIFVTNYDTVAIKEERYELMRYWLLGNWIANQLGLHFQLYSLVMQSREIELEIEFDKLISESEKRKFSRLTWEDIYNFILNIKESQEKKIILQYFKNKTLGYDSDHQLIKAFNVI